MIIFANTKGITIVAMPNLKCSLIYEVQIYKKNQLRSETRWRKWYCDSYEIIYTSMSEGYAFGLMAMGSSPQ